MQNNRHKKRLIKLLLNIDNFTPLDIYLSKIFDREIKYSWKIFRHVAIHIQEGSLWEWSDYSQSAFYGKSHVPRFATFCTLALHECAHGLCYFLSKSNRKRKYANGINEEQVCHEISEMICKKINVEFTKWLAELAYEISITKDKEKLHKLVLKVPLYISLPQNITK